METVADLMLDGTLCAHCGTYVQHGDAHGFPRYCSKKCERAAAPDETRVGGGAT